MERRKILIVFLVIGLCAVAFLFHEWNSSGQSLPNYEAAGTVVEVLDGDTLIAEIEEISDPHEGISTKEEKIRLAGVDARELKVGNVRSGDGQMENLTQEEYEMTERYSYARRARELLRSLAPVGKKIYLDFDDLAEGEGPYYNPYRGNYDRIIAVIYVVDNGDWLNLNAEILREYYPDHAGVTGYVSEFDYRDWLDVDG